MSLLEFSDCFLTVSFNLFFYPCISYKQAMNYKGLIRFRLNIFDKNTSQVLLLYLILRHNKRNIMSKWPTSNAAEFV